MKMSVKISAKIKTPLIVLCFLVVFVPLTLLLLSSHAGESETRDNLAVWRPETRPGDLTSYSPTECVTMNRGASLSRSNESAVLGGAGGTKKEDPPHSYYGRGWSPAGQWWQLSDISTSGYERIELSFSVRGSNTGPKNFSLGYSADGQEWLPLTDSGGARISYTVAADNKFHQYGPFKLPVAIEGADRLYIRFMNTDEESVAGGTIGNTGTNYITGITITGIPAP